MRRPFKLPSVSAPCSSGCWCVCVHVCYTCSYTNTAAFTCYTPSFCSSQVLELKGLLARALCAQLVSPSSLLPSPCHPGWNQDGRPRTVLPTPSSAGAQDEGAREKDPAPTPRGCGTGKWQAALQAAENRHYPRGAVLGGRPGFFHLSSVLLGLYQGGKLLVIW